jgi:CheY-like chemotaxis protein/signal transduction histidine kinase
LNGSKIDLIVKLIELSEYAHRGDEFLPDEICNFLVNEFDLSAAVIFEIKNSSYYVAGKSAGVKNNFQNGASFFCGSCQASVNKVNCKFEQIPTCNINISDNISNEVCSYLEVSNSFKLLIKAARKSSFTQNDKESLEKTLQLISSILYVWNNKRGGDQSSISLSNIINETSTELKSISNSIVGYTTIISNVNPNSSQSDYFSAIKKNAQSILLNVNDLSELSKIEANTVTTNKKSVVLQALVNEIVELFRVRTGNKKIEFIVDISDNLSKTIDLDDQKLRYILTSLLFVSTSLTTLGEITIKITPLNDNKISFLITDTGKPISSQIINKVFEPFSLSKLDEFKQSPLSGLSLTLVKNYTILLGGEIWASSSDKGNSFKFTIKGEVMSDLENRISQLPKPTSLNKVLVIEDDYATSKLLSNYLNKWGYDPTIVSNEDQAFNVIDKEQLLAVILDIELPNINGLELLKKIHEHNNTKNTPVIVCSVEPEQQKAFMMGAVEYFIKPINYNFLVEVLTSYKLRKNSNVLCVDDDLPTLNLIKQAIETAGFVAVAENISANVMDNIKDKDIDLAIVDLDMPAPNGFELIKLIKSEKKFAKLPIIIYTGKENYKEDLSKIEGLFEDLLDKRSTNMEDLADVINSMINKIETPPTVEEVHNKQNVIKILLAEDYKHSQIIVTRLLKKNSFENVVVVENGEDAVKMAKQETFNLILMDMQMPIMNGFEATEKIRELSEYKNTPIIALTAFAMKGDREKCLEAGATDYIPKPIDSKEFIEKVKFYTTA